MSGVLNTLDPLDALILSLGVGSYDQTTTGLDMVRSSMIWITGVDAPGCNVTLFPYRWTGSVMSDSNNTNDVLIHCGGTILTITPGEEFTLQLDGTPGGMVRSSNLAGGSLLLSQLNLSTIKTQILSMSLAQGDRIVTPLLFKEVTVFRFTGADGVGDTVTLPAEPGLRIYGSEDSNSGTIYVKIGNATITLLPGQIKAGFSDGGASGLIELPIATESPPSWLAETVQNYLEGKAFKLKDPVACATTGNITLSGEKVIDGITTNLSPVLVKNQTSATENGLYLSAPGAWARVSTANTWDLLVSAYVPVDDGLVNGGTAWVSEADPAGSLGVANIPWREFSTGAKRSTTAGLSPTAGGAVGTSGQVARADHRHPLSVSTDIADFVEAVQDATAVMLVNTGDITFNYNDAANQVAATINAKAVTYAKLQDVSAQNRFLLRKSAGAGPVEEGTPAEVAAILPTFVVEGGAAAPGMVPSPGAADADFFRNFRPKDGWYRSKTSYHSGCGYVDYSQPLAASAIIPGTNTLYFYWFNLDGQANIASVVTKVGTPGTAGTSKFRVGLFAADPANKGFPGLKLAECTTEQAGDAIAGTVIQTVFDAPGLGDAPGVWIAHSYNGAALDVKLNRQVDTKSATRGVGMANAADTMAGSTSIITGVEAPYAYGVMPANGNSLTFVRSSKCMTFAIMIA